jgi:hypothetical protein
LIIDVLKCLVKFPYLPSGPPEILTVFAVNGLVSVLITSIVQVGISVSIAVSLDLPPKGLFGLQAIQNHRLGLGSYTRRDPLFSAHDHLLRCDGRASGPIPSSTSACVEKGHDLSRHSCHPNGQSAGCCALSCSLEATTRVSCVESPYGPQWPLAYTHSASLWLRCRR